MTFFGVKYSKCIPFLFLIGCREPTAPIRAHGAGCWIVTRAPLDSNGVDYGTVVVRAHYATCPIADLIWDASES